MERIEIPTLGAWETDQRVAALYEATIARTGRPIPLLDPVLERVVARRQVIDGLNRNPADALFARHDVEYPYSCTFGDAQLTIDEGVFCPTFTRVSAFLLSTVDFKPGERVLDAFAGSGAFGVNAALRGAEKVVSVDISKAAIDCTQKNAHANNTPIETRLGTVKDRISEGETFDLLVANPPLLPGEPTDQLTAAVFDEGLQATLDFIEHLPHILSKSGRCYLVTSDILERCRFNIPDLCRRVGLRTLAIATENTGYETYTVHKIEPRRLANVLWLLKR